MQTTCNSKITTRIVLQLSFFTMLQIIKNTNLRCNRKWTSASAASEERLVASVPPRCKECPGRRGSR